MKTVTSISGGKTSAYLAARYPTEYNVFALVRIEDKKCQFPDRKIRQHVEDRIQMPFIGTAEDDTIIYTILDLEQHIGQKISWVSGQTFEKVIESKGGYLPNKTARFCTTHLKMFPIFYWWAERIGEPVEMNIGFRANEQRRANKMMDKLNSNGLSEMKATFEKLPDGRNKWEMVEWRRPAFPLITDQVWKDEIELYWQDKNVRFAKLNNCIGCFHRNPILLKKMYDAHPEKMDWFSNQEKKSKGQWRSDVSYQQIKKHKLQFELSFDEFSECDSGFCGL